MDVVIEQSSGYDQVLGGWRFQAAMVVGEAVNAWARGPLSLDLRQQ